MKSFRPARKRIDVSVGESVRIIRELRGYSQNELARLTGIPQGTLSAIEIASGLASSAPRFSGER